MGSHKKFDSSSDCEGEVRQKRDRDSKKSESKKKKYESDSEDEGVSKKKARKDYESGKEKQRSEERRQESKRDDRSGGGDYRRDDYRDRRDRRDDRQRDYKDREGRDRKRDRGDEHRRKEDNKLWEKKLSQDEINKQRKMLWSKPKTQEESETNNAEPTSSDAPPAPTDKKAAQWSSSIAAAGVSGQQSMKFLKLMGIKSTPAAQMSQDQLQSEHNRQQKMKSDLDKQYQIARESTHMGKGMGLGFH